MRLKKPGEVLADPLDNFNNALKRWEDAHGLGLSHEDYAEGWMAIHIHYVLRRRISEPSDFCVVLKPHKDKPSLDLYGANALFRGFDDYLTFLKDSESWQQQFVLV